MGDGVSIDLGSAAPYIVDSVLGWFGKDAESVEWRNKIGELVKLSAQQASSVQCVGMPEPISIDHIYQKTTLYAPASGRKLDFQSIIDAKESAVVFAGPGWGKTTLLHWLYFTLVRGELLDADA